MPRHSHRIYVKLVLLLIILAPHYTSAAQSRTTRLTILTTNDLHGQLTPYRTAEPGATRSIGGFSRLAAAIARIKNTSSHPVLCLNSGDTLTGTFFRHFKGEALLTTLNLIGIDAATLGNHEFDRGTATLAQALAFAEFPICVSNLQLAHASALSRRLQPFRVITKNGLRVGLFGLITPDLPLLCRTGPQVEGINDPVVTARRMVALLREQEQVDLVIALTHLGLAADITLARLVSGIDVICGGHSHNLLGGGKEIIIPHQNGRSTIILQAGARGTHLGVLNLELSQKTVTSHTWEPLVIDDSINPDHGLENLIENFRNRLPAATNLTTTLTPLDCRGATLRKQEAAVGNLVADIVRGYFQTDIALQNGGGLRGNRVIPAGPVSNADIDTLLPFDNRITILQLTGKQIKQVLERSAAFLPQPFGGFLQVSGLRLTIDPNGTPQTLRRNAHNNPAGILQ
ncbi:MAG: bifunctional metallophosphatase/5'-nucleotidase, partial [Deltaproteobacteria bacterium]|nr:bifunctional metallophosphatase/5'-nucleotidase [Deltaproteobacteria bacterium]